MQEQLTGGQPATRGWRGQDRLRALEMDPRQERCTRVAVVTIGFPRRCATDRAGRESSGDLRPGAERAMLEHSAPSPPACRPARPSFSTSGATFALPETLR